MTKKIRRSMFKHMFLDFEKEEEWLNAMSKDGYALRNFENGYYVFETCEPGEYTFQISLFQQDDKDNEDRFLQSMKKDKATFVTSIHNWYYFRKKSSLGDFSINADLEAKSRYYKKISFVWYSLAVICLLFAFIDFVVVTSMNMADQDYLFNLFFLILGLIFLLIAYSLTKKVKRLKSK